MSDIVISIKPEFSRQILGRAKKIEFRKKFPLSFKGRIFIYESYPTQKVVASFTPKRIEFLKVTDIKKRYSKYKTDLNWYFKGKTHGYCVHVSKLRIFREPKKLQDFGGGKGSAELLLSLTL